MSCHGCASKFGLWVRENGCPACGFSFCGSCLKIKCAVPKLENKIHKVCKKCHDAISSSEKGCMETGTPSNITPPDIFLKRLEALEAPPKPPVTVYRSEPRMQSLMKGLNNIDLDIARRLEKLREDRRAAKNLPSEEEIAQRLARLKGQDGDDLPTKSNYAHLAPDSRSEEQQTHDLMMQYKEEVVLDARTPKPEDEIADRLNRLRNDQPGHSNEVASDNLEAVTLDEIALLLAQCKMEASESGKQLDLATVVCLEKLRTRLVQQNKTTIKESSSSDEDEDKAARKIMSRVQAEVDLEKSLGIDKDSEEENEIMDVDNDTEELPWCIICNEDAKVRCLSCDRDLYCQSCFQEGHADEDMRSHQVEPFKKK